MECAVTGGAASPEFTKLCAWVVSELQLYCRLEEKVHATNSETLSQKHPEITNLNHGSRDRMQREKSEKAKVGGVLVVNEPSVSHL